MSFSLKLLGGVALEGEGGPLTGPAVQRHRLALLALLATSHPRVVSRDKLMAVLWPERESEPARRLLNQAVHVLRQALGAEAILSSGDELQLNPGIVHSDVVVFEAALGGGESERAVGIYRGPLLDGFFLDDAPEFERWVDRERDRLAGAYSRALEGLAEGAERAGAWSAAVGWWKAMAAHDPYDTRVALRLMQAMERSGNRAGALQHATLHQQRLREELEVEQVPEVEALVERLRREPAVVAAQQRGATDRPAARPAPEVSARADAPPRRRRTARYAVAILLLAGAMGSVTWLASRDRAANMVAPTVVDEIAQAVARELDRRERGDTASRLPQNRTRSIPAYELYLRGNDPALLRSDSGARRGLDYFRRAVALDSTYAAAWVGLARMTLRTTEPGPAAAAAARAQAEAAVRTALALDDSLAEAHAVLGGLRGMGSDLAAAEQHLRQAIDLEPTRARFREMFSQFYLRTGRPVEALAEAERAAALEPMSPSATAEVARALLANDRCEEALARLESIAALDPPLLRAIPIAAQCHGRMGRLDEAIALLRPQAETGDPQALALLGYMLGRAGQRTEALSIQADLQARQRSGAVGAHELAYVPAALGDRDEAFAWLDRAHRDGSLGLAPGRHMMLVGALPDALGRDPRWARLKKRLGAANP